MGTQAEIFDLKNGDEAAASEFLKEMEIDVLARTLWGEARSEGSKGMEAVAYVVLNRVKIAKANGNRHWWGHDIITVCQKPYQFSCWNPGDPNRPKMMAVDKNDIHFATCLRVAQRAVYGQLNDDMTHGADHYHAKNVAPVWTKGREAVATIGNHIFYKLEG